MKQLIATLILTSSLLGSIQAQYKYSYQWDPSPTQYVKSHKKEIFTYQEYLEVSQRNEIFFVATVNVKTHQIESVEYTPIESEIQVLDHGKDLDPELVKKIALKLQQNITIRNFITDRITENTVRLTMSLFFDKKDRKKVKPW